MQEEFKIRNISCEDDLPIASIIRSSLKEFKANKPGTVYYDETTDHLYRVFAKPRSTYFVVTINGKISGGAGIYPTDGLPTDICELVKMYLSAEARGKGIGKLLMNACIDEAKKHGFKKIYLETMPELILAIRMYERFGFTFIPSALGNSGHVGCDVFMLKEI